MKPSKKNLILVILAAGATSAHSATINQTVLTGNRSWLDSIWGSSPVAAPTTSNDYIIANQVRTSPAGGAANGNSNFTGNSITAPTSTIFLVKQEGGETASINSGAGNLILNGGDLQYAPNTVGTGRMTLDLGNLDVTANSVIRLGDVGFGFNVAGTLTGSGNLNFFMTTNTQTTAKGVSFDSISAYTGGIKLQDGLTLAFGNDYAFSSTMELTDLSKLNVSKVYTFLEGSLSDPTNGVVAPGTYTGASLTALGANYLNNGGTIVVIPEPTAPSLAATALVGALLLRRRRR